MFESIRYSEYLGVAIYNDGSDSSYELTIDFKDNSVCYANQYVQYPIEHKLY